MPIIEHTRWPTTIPTIEVHRHRSNRGVVLLYTSPTQRANLTTVQRMMLSFGADTDPDVVIDSDDWPNVFDWRARGCEGYVNLYLGYWDPPCGFDLTTRYAQLLVFDPGWTNGLEWGTVRVRWPESGPKLEMWHDYI